jgi:hypothetical protein
MPLAAGTRLGPYEILSPLGAGGMGEVYRARDTRLQREVAVKVLPSTVASDPDRLRRFEKESRAASALNHPAIVTIYDVGQTDGVSWIAMELVEGKTLRELLVPGPMPVKRLLQLAPAIAEGLARAHESGIVHRDLKPENVMVTKEGLVKILDFGLAKLSAPSSGSDQDSRLPTATGTSPGVVLGTVSYMSPEQASGQNVEFRSDQFSLGSILYEMATGKKAFQKKTPVDTLAAILNEEPEPVGAINPQVPVPLRWIVERCMAKVPEERYVATRDLARELATIQTHLSDTLSGAGPSRGVGRRLSIPWWIALPLAALLVAGGVYGARRLALQSAKSVVPTFRRLTFRRGNVLTARFAPDGQTVVYGAAWEGKPSELFTVRTDSFESRPLGLDHANVLSVSSKGELAVSLGKGNLQNPQIPGTLARVPLGGGAPRELQEDVYSAAWTPDGDNLAVTRRVPSGKNVLEFPVGRPITESFSLWISTRVSPSGDEVAFCELDTNNQIAIWVSDRQGRKRALVKGLKTLVGSAFSPRTGELFYIGGRQAGDAALRAVSMSGRERVVWPGANGYILHDIAPDGRLLIERYTQRRGVIWVPADGAAERELGWLDSSTPYDVSRDGSQVLFAEDGEGGGTVPGVFLRRTDGSPAVRLGDGKPMSLSPDGKWALALTTTATPEIALLPTGVGSPRKIPIEGPKPDGATFIGDGSQIAVWYSVQGGPNQVAVVSVEGGRPKTIPLPGKAGGSAFSQDGTRIAYGDTDRKIKIAALSGGTPLTIPGATLEPCEGILDWSRDSRYLIVDTQCGEIPKRVTRISVEDGQRVLLKEIQPADRSGVIAIYAVAFTSDQVGYVYGYTRMLASDLYLVDGLK